MKKEYHYKVKRNWLKMDTTKYEPRAKIQDFGFEPFIPDEGSEEGVYWAKPITVGVDTKIAGWIKHQMEKIYQKGGEEWANEILQQGFEFNEQENLIINDAFLDSLKGQLCISVNRGEYDFACLFINLEGTEWGSCEFLDDALKEEVEKMLSAGMIYKKRFLARETRNL